MLMTLAVFGLAIELRPSLPGEAIARGSVGHVPLLYMAVLLCWHVPMVMTGVYETARIPSFSKQFGVFSSAYLLAVFMFSGFLYFTYRDFSRMTVLYFSATNFALLLIIRFVLTRYLTSKRAGLSRTKVLIIGTTDNAIELAKTLVESHSSIYSVEGFVHGYEEMPESLPVSVIGSTDDVQRIIEDRNIEMVIMALPESRTREIERLIVDLYLLPVRIYLVPDLVKLTLMQSEVEYFGKSLVIGIREPVIQGSRRAVKRGFDLLASIGLFLVLWPFLLLIALLIKLDSPGPVIYRARRVGENGKLFDMLKFRTMKVGADKLQYQATEVDESGKIVYKTKGDPRVTRFGRFLRKTSLDELPQLFNVIKGEMSLVGPRPEQPFITESYAEWQWGRLAVPPGVTGWWQVSGRSDLPLHLNTQYDLYYVRNYSFLLDLRILLKTVVVVLKGRGAY